MDHETGLVRRRVFSSGPRAAAAAVLSVAALLAAAGLGGSPADAAGRVPAGSGGVAAVTPTGDPTDPPASPQIVVGTVVHYRVVPVGFSAAVVGLLQRPLGMAINARLQRERSSGWVTVATQVVPASTTSVSTHATFPVSTTTTGRRTYRIVASSASGAAQSATGPQRTMTVVAARITAVHPSGDEYVTLKNAGTTAFDLRKWTLGTDRLFITLPHRVVRPGQYLRIYTGPGTSTAHRLYVSRLGNLWHQHGTVLLQTRNHVLIRSRTF
jgi:hypothetical protein